MLSDAVAALNPIVDRTSRVDQGARHDPGVEPWGYHAIKLVGADDSVEVSPRRRRSHERRPVEKSQVGHRNSLVK